MKRMGLPKNQLFLPLDYRKQYPLIHEEGDQLKNIHAVSGIL